MIIGDSMHDRNELVVGDGKLIIQALLERSCNSGSDLVRNMSRVGFPEIGHLSEQTNSSAKSKSLTNNSPRVYQRAMPPRSALPRTTRSPFWRRYPHPHPQIRVDPHNSNRVDLSLLLMRKRYTKAPWRDSKVREVRQAHASLPTRECGEEELHWRRKVGIGWAEGSRAGRKKGDSQSSS
jgi:hypothetical protein